MRASAMFARQAAAMQPTAMQPAAMQPAAGHMGASQMGSRGAGGSAGDGGVDRRAVDAGAWASRNMSRAGDAHMAVPRSNRARNMRGIAQRTRDMRA
jgi:hypothetical protein